MPPKKKSTSKTPAKARTPTLIDGLTKEEMSKEQLEEHIVHLREELDREREERNYFQLERDQIHNFWEITERNLAEVKAELKNLEKEIEEDEGRHRVEIKVYKQKMKHLLCEHQNKIAELKASVLVSTEMMQKEQEELETELHKKMKAIMVDIQEIDNDNLIRELELEEIASITEKQKVMKKDLKLVSLDNTRLAESISKVEEANAEVEKKVKYYSAKKDPSNTIEELKKKELENLKREHEVLGEKFTKLQMERDELYKTFPQNIQKVQHKADQVTMLLEKKLQALTDSVEDVEAQLRSVLSASNIDQTALSGVISKVEARRDLLLTIEVKQRALGVPVEELCVNP